MRRRKLNRRRGESLLEVIIAVSILSTIMVSVFSLIIRGASTNTNVTNRVVAINVAREGVEAVRNIRDTNWLKYSGDRRGKWLCYDTTSNPNACEDNNDPVISVGNYTVDFNDGEGRYFLNLENTTLMTDKDVLPAEDFRLYADAGVSDRFLHSATGGEITKYYRQVRLVPEIDAGVSGACASAGCPINSRLLVSVRVQWQEEGSVRRLDMETYLYDFFGRDEY